MSAGPSAARPAESFPGAVAPERSRDFQSVGVRLRIHEWGDPEAMPLVCCHGMFDHGRGFDLLAPLLARHFRVISFDARGHGESGWAHSYSWRSDLWDIVHLVRSLGRPVHLVGHSKGGGQATDAAMLASEVVRQVVNIDGFGPPPPGVDPEHDRHMEGRVADHFAQYLDGRRHAHRKLRWRVYPSFEDLVVRRRRQNPRLGEPWLHYFLGYAAKEVEGGWCWKADPYARGGFGPFRPDWIAPGWEPLEAPMLAITGSVADAWGPLPDFALEERIAYVRRVERAVVEDAGHFVHMEKPEETARAILDFLDR